MRRGGLVAVAVFGSLAAMLCLGTRSAAAQGVTAALYPETLTVAPGDVLALELRVLQAGSAFNGFDATVSYDASALTFQPLSPVSLQQGVLMTSACGNLFHRFHAGAGVDTISDVLLCAGASVTGPGQIYQLRFQASTTPQVARVHLVPGTLKFYNAGLFVTPVTSADAVIGIGTAPAAVGAPVGTGGPALLAAPNPGRGSITFTSGWRATGTESLMVRDVQGRAVHVQRFEGHRASWDGRLDSGAYAADGVYFATLQAGGHSTTIRFSWIH